ncbi:MAG: sugar phosphate isomerase/epimerase family protein [Bryobacteraceae bacterium]
MTPSALSRRSLLALAAAGRLAAAKGNKAKKHKGLPVGLELYSVRGELKKDLMGTVREVAKLGYDGVEFYAPYFEWTAAQAKDMRKLLDDSGMRCFSTHNSFKSFVPENLPHAIEINQIIGSKFIVMASAGRVEGLDGWKGVAENLSKAAEKLRPLGLRAGYHNHAAEFKTVDGKRPMEVLAANTPKDVMLQLDVGTCIEVGSDPVAWIEANPGRIASLHLKDWAKGDPKEKGFRVLFGEGEAPWKQILRVARKTGGAEYVLIEQEGSRFSEFETAGKCLEAYRKLAARG